MSATLTDSCLLLAKKVGIVIFMLLVAIADLQAQTLNQLQLNLENATTAGPRIVAMVEISNYYSKQKDFSQALEYLAKGMAINDKENIYRYDHDIFDACIHKIVDNCALDSFKLALKSLPTGIQTAAFLNLLSLADYRGYNSDFAGELAQQAQDMAKKSHNTLQEGFSYFHLGRYLYSMGKNRQSETRLLRASELFYKAQDTLAIIDAVMLLGRVNKWLYKLDKAEKHLNEALKLSYAIHSWENVFWCLTKIQDVKEWRGNYKEVQILQDKILKLANERLSDMPKLIKTAEWNQGIIYMETGKYEEALPFIRKGIEEMMVSGQNRILSMRFHNLGNCYMGMGVYDSAYISYKKSLDFGKKYNNNYMCCQTLGKIVSLYLKIGDRKAAEEYAQQLEELLGELKTKDEVKTQIFRNEWKIEHFEQIGLLDSAVVYAEKELALSEKQGNSHILPNTMLKLGKLHGKLRNFKVAKAYLLDALKIARLSGQEGVGCRLQLALAENANAEGDFKYALDHAKQGLEAAKRLQMTIVIPDLFKALSEANSGLGNFKNAYFYQDSLKNAQDSLISVAEVQQIAKYESLYKLKEKEMENLRLQVEKAQKDQLIHKRTTQTLGLIGIIILVVIAAYLIKERAKLRAEHQLRKQITRDIHDDVGSTLNTLKLTIKEAIEAQPNSSTDLQKLNRAVQLGNQAVESLKT